MPLETRAERRNESVRARGELGMARPQPGRRLSPRVVLVVATIVCSAGLVCQFTGRHQQPTLPPEQSSWVEPATIDAASRTPRRRVEHIPSLEAEPQPTRVLGIAKSTTDAPPPSLEPGGVQVSGSVVDASGGPIVDARVNATRAGGRPLALAVTGATGQFVMTVPPGGLQLVARADGYARVDRQVDAPNDGVELILTPASSIRGTIRVEETDEPAAGVEVTAFNVSGLLVGPRTATTDEQGTFEILELPAGEYRVDAASARWRSAERRLVLEVTEEETVDLWVTAATRFEARVRAGGATCKRGLVGLKGPISAVRDLDERGHVEFFGLLPGSYRVDVMCDPGLELTEEIDVGSEPIARDWNLDQRLSVKGVVTTWAGAPVAGARIEIAPTGERRASVVCSSDERGAFACFGLDPGQYECQLRENAVARSQSVPVTLTEGSAPPEVVLRADATATLSVRIDSAGMLQLGALAVVAQRPGTAPLMAERRGDEFVLEQVPLGVYDVMIDPEVQGARRTVELGRADAVVEVSLAAPQPQTLSGRVVDERGNGVPDAWIRVGGTSLYGALHPASPVMSDADGAFAIVGLLPGTYELSATSDGGEARLDEVANDGRPVIVRLRGTSPPL
jgi:hypothetical protein